MATPSITGGVDEKSTLSDLACAVGTDIATSSAEVSAASYMFYFSIGYALYLLICILNYHVLTPSALENSAKHPLSFLEALPICNGNWYKKDIRSPLLWLCHFKTRAITSLRRQRGSQYKKLSKIFDYFIALIIVNVVAMMLETVPGIPAIWQYELHIIEVVSVLIFTVEYFRLYGSHRPKPP